MSNFAVKADGTFSVDSDLPFADPVMQWEVHVVHQRGVACLQFNTQR
jgi:hypothetical protein